LQLEDEIWLQLKALGLIPGTALKWSECDQATGICSFNVACKWKRKWGWAPDEGWFILTNLSDLESAILAYKKLLELRRCARDFKSGGYNLEGTRITEIAWLC